MKNFFYCALIAFSFLTVQACDKGVGGGTDNNGNQSGGDSPFDNLENAETELYAYSNALLPSRYYNVKVNGQEALVLPCIDEPQGGQPDYEHNICTFGCNGKVLVEVSSYSELITEAKVLPESRGYQSRIVDGNLQVILEPGDRVAVEINGKEDNDLFIFVNHLETDKPAEDAANVRFFRAGEIYDANTISLHNGETVYIEGGAIVKANVSGTQVSDVALKGYGILDARGLTSRGIQINSSQNIEIDGITLLNDRAWSTFITCSDNIKINNYKVIAVYSPESGKKGRENDALDLLGCTNAEVTHCFGYTHDDVFCIKSQKWTFSGKVDNILFDDCIAWNYQGGNSFIIGAEINQDVSNVTYKNCVSIHSAGDSNRLQRGALSVHNCASAHVSNILFENIVLEDSKECAIHLDIRHSYVGNLGNDVEYAPGTCDGITLRNINIMKKPGYGNMAFGYDENHKFTNVVFDNVCQEGVKITSDNISRFFDPNLKFVYKEQNSANLSNIEITYK